MSHYESPHPLLTSSLLVDHRKGGFLENVQGEIEWVIINPADCDDDESAVDIPTDVAMQIDVLVRGYLFEWDEDKTHPEINLQLT